MTNWKCICGVVNFSIDETCKRCQSVKPMQSFSSSIPEFFEHSAPNGDAASGISKAVGIGSLLGGFALAALAVTNSTDATKGYALTLALFFTFQGAVLFALFFGFGVLIENLVAIRKNTQHLAGIRTNITQQHEAN